MLKRFQALGVEIALDDFGTGFASMTGLKNLPVNLLKLDMSFVRGITDDVYDQAIVESIIRLGRALNLGVIAEGIESRSIVSKLLELGCDRGQGYLISRPVAPIELAPMLSSGSVPVSILRRGGERTLGTGGPAAVSSTNGVTTDSTDRDNATPAEVVPTPDGGVADVSSTPSGPDFASQFYEPWLFQTMLSHLSASELGVGFVYSILELLAERHDLDDVVVVLAHESFGTQMFRRGGRLAHG